MQKHSEIKIVNRSSVGHFGYKKIRNVVDVARWRLCVGCGACISICPSERLILRDVTNDGLRPFFVDDKRPSDDAVFCNTCSECLSVCPGLHMKAPTLQASPKIKTGSLNKGWGFMLELWEGYASDPEIRFKGSSGGLCTALSLFCIENGLAAGVMHIGASEKQPWLNKTFLSTNRDELISRTGSRYAPASPCNKLNIVEKFSKPIVFVGKPCDIEALRMVEEKVSYVRKNMAFVIGFFCAGTPSTKGTLDLLSYHNLNYQNLSTLRYRGLGWPGKTTISLKDKQIDVLQLTYEEAWGFLQRYRPFRCYLCPDITAESADISVGDPWYRERGNEEPGRSLIIIRSERGLKIFYNALEKGYIRAERVSPDIILKSQRNLLGKRKAIFGRLLGMKLLGIPHPTLDGFHLHENWMDLSLKEKIISVAGTIRRIVQRRYYKPLKFG